MKLFALKELYEKGLLTNTAFQRISDRHTNKPVSLQPELKTLMYAGIVLLTTGLGIIVYKHLDSISHVVILISIAIAMVSCFTYCIRKAAPFTTHQAAKPNLVNDYILLLGCLLLLILTGYLQFQYQLFGDKWGLATFLPMIILFVCAYYFDHLGVLSMAIVNLAAWAGITVTPKYLLRNNDFNDSNLIYTALALGLLLLSVAHLSAKRNLKPHFAFAYKNFGLHILFVALIAGIIHFRAYELLWLALLGVTCYWQFVSACQQKSFYFLTSVVLYFYSGVSYVIIRRLLNISFGNGMLYAIFLYFIVTAVLCVALLMHFNKILRRP